MSQRIRWIGMTAIILIIIIITFIYIVGQNVATHLLTVNWNASSSTSFSASDRTIILQKIHDMIANSGSSTANIHTLIISSAARQGNQAVFTLNANSSESLTVIGEYQQGTWQLWDPNSPDFCAQVARFPEILLSMLDKYYLCPQ